MLYVQYFKSVFEFESVFLFLKWVNKNSDKTSVWLFCVTARYIYHISFRMICEKQISWGRPGNRICCPKDLSWHNGKGLPCYRKDFFKWIEKGCIIYKLKAMNIICHFEILLFILLTELINMQNKYTQEIYHITITRKSDISY